MKRTLISFLLLIVIISFNSYSQQTIQVTIDQQLSDGTTTGSIDRVKKWNGSDFNAYSTIPTLDYFQVGSHPTLLGTQNIISSQKYLKWQKNFNDESDILNFHKFTVQTGDHHYISKLNPTNLGVTIRNNLEEMYLEGGTIYFTDPWFANYEDPAYPYPNTIKRNQGINALPIPQNSPFYPNGTTSYNGTKYFGVLPGQNQSYSANIPGYIVGVDAVQNIKLYNTGIPAPTGRYHKAYFQNWTGTDVNFQNANNSTTRLVFPTSNTTVKANIKVSGLSNISDAFANGTQRRLVKDNNKLYKVYESEIKEINSIWLESSEDGGVTWIVENGGKSIADNAKCPSLYYFTASGEPSHLLIAYQQDDLQIYVVNYEPSGSGIGVVSSACEGTMMITDNPNNLPIYPVVAIAWDNSPTAVITYSVNNTIKAFFGLCDSWSNTFIIRNPLTQVVLSTNGTTPALETYSSWFYLVYPNSIYTEMNFKRFHSTDDNTQLIWDEYKLLSERSGYTNHYSPSLVVLNDTYARICWMGTRVDLQPDITNGSIPVNRVVFRGQNNDGHFWSFGNYVSPPSINKAIGLNQNYYAMAWNQNNNSTYFADNTLSITRLMSSLPGKSVQLSNGSASDQMFAEVFNANSSPYYFKTSNSIGSYYAPQKINTYSFASGREGVIAKDTAQFFFTVGDIIADGQPISFITIPDSVSFNSKEILNTYLESEPFQLSDNSTFMYSIQYGITDSSASVALLNNSNKFISFKIELLDKQTSQVLGTYDEVTYNSSNIFQYNNLCYEVGTSGIGNRQVYLRLVVNDNIEPDYSLGELYSSDNVLEKINRISIGYKGLESVTSYDLVQNFPNPFNPSTTISYQIPQNGLVTLKVYDILGSEVATLINEEKLAGKYEVNFNASQLSSGVYIYKIQSGDFISSKKMILLK